MNSSIVARADIKLVHAVCSSLAVDAMDAKCVNISLVTLFVVLEPNINPL